MQNSSFCIFCSCISVFLRVCVLCFAFMSLIIALCLCICEVQNTHAYSGVCISVVTYGSSYVMLMIHTGRPTCRPAVLDGPVGSMLNVSAASQNYLSSNSQDPFFRHRGFESFPIHISLSSVLLINFCILTYTSSVEQ